MANHPTTSVCSATMTKSILRQTFKTHPGPTGCHVCHQRFHGLFLDKENKRNRHETDTRIHRHTHTHTHCCKKNTSELFVPSNTFTQSRSASVYLYVVYRNILKKPMHLGANLHASKWLRIKSAWSVFHFLLCTEGLSRFLQVSHIHAQ